MAEGEVLMFYCPMKGKMTDECNYPHCVYTPCGFKRTGKHTSEKLTIKTIEGEP